MTGLSVSDELKTIESEIKKRAHEHNKSAFHDMIIIVITLLACVLIFAAADEISSFFKIPTPTEKALDDAQAKLYVSISSLADPLAEYIRKLGPRLEPALDRIILEYLPRGDKQSSEGDKQSSEGDKQSSEGDKQSNAVHRPDLNGLLESKLSELRSELRTPEVAPTPKDQQSETNERSGINRSVFGRDRNDIARQLLHQSKLVESQEQLLSLYEKNATKDAQIDIAQIHADAEREIADTRAFTDRQIAQDKANSEVEVAREKSNAEVEVARAEKDRAQEETERAEAMKQLASNAITRLGSVVMVIWLVRIFVAKRHRSVELAAFYFSIADAMAVARSTNVPFVDLIVTPPRAHEVEKADTPSGLLMKIFEHIRT